MASTAAAVAPKAAAVAAKVAKAAPLAGADCTIRITGDSQGGISRASMDCSGGPVRVGVHSQLLGPFQQSFRGVFWDPECARPSCLVLFCGDTTVSINNSTITGVLFAGAHVAHAVLCVADSTQMELRSTSISSNNATAIVVGDNAELRVLGSTLAANIAYGQPGGVLAVNSSTVVVAGGSVIRGNTASNASGGGVGVHDSAVFVLSGGSRIVNNTSTWGSGGGLAVVGRGETRIEGSSAVCNNTCWYGVGGGGGIAVAGQGQLALVGDSVVCYNRGGYRGGGVAVVDNATVTIHSSSISGNTAYASGGGVVVGGSGNVTVFDSVIKNNTSFEGRGANLGGGAVAVLGSAKVQLFNGTKLLGNRAVGLPGGAFVLDTAASLLVAAGVQFSDNTVVANTSSRVAPYGPVGVAVKASKLDIKPGVRGQREPLTKCSRSVVLFRRPCGVGEFDGGEGSTCQCCPPFTYSFEANVTSCRECPVNADCSADIVSPVAGYWHSSPRSLQMHRCPISRSCQKGGVCLPGYTGNLCGKCDEGFGTTSPLQCRKCMAPEEQFGIFMALMGGLVLLVSLTVHFTWQDNKLMNRSSRAADLIKVEVQYLQYVGLLSSIAIPWPSFLVPPLVGVARATSTLTGVGLMMDCWLPHFVPIQAPLALQRTLASFVGAGLVAVACAVLMNLLHVCNRVLTACVSRMRRQDEASTQQRVPRLHFWSRLRVTLLVTVFYEYPMLVRGALSFFACLPIDVAGEQPHPEYAIRNHTAGYWVSDIQQECFAGWHRHWALYFGVPVALLLCVGVPVGLFVFLWLNNTKTYDDVAFWEHYGFLFRNYTLSKPWWEAVWTAQTVLLASVSVFHVMFQAYYALLVMQLILLSSAGVQVIARPYAKRLLHQVHLTSTMCLSLIVWLCLALFSDSVEADSTTLYRAHSFVGALVLLLVVGYSVWMVGLIVPALFPALKLLVQAHVYRASFVVRRCTRGAVTCCQPHEDPLPVCPSGQPNWARSEPPLVAVIDRNRTRGGDMAHGVTEQDVPEQGDMEHGGLEGGVSEQGGMQQGCMEEGGVEEGGVEQGGVRLRGMGLGEIEVCNSDDSF
jgi:hypothetical protein